MGRDRLQGRNRFRPVFESLEDRIVPTITIFVIPNPANGSPNDIDLRIVGDNKAHNVTITDNQNATINAVGVNTNGEKTFIRNPNGTLIAAAPNGVTGTGPGANNGFFTNVGSEEIKFGKGNDTLTYILSGWSAGDQHRSISVDMGAGNDSFTFNAAGTPITGADLTVNYNGGNGNDIASFSFASIDNSKVTIAGDAGFGNDTTTVAFTGAITNGATVTDSQNMNAGNDSLAVSVTGNVILGSTLTENDDLGGGTNTETVTQNNSVLNDSKVNLNILGGAESDFVGVALNNTILNTGQEAVDANLGCGNDQFNGTFGPNFQITGAGAQATWDVNGGQGNDTINVQNTAAMAAPGTISGLLSINLDGGTGNDVLNASGTGLIMATPGNYQLRINGGDGNDTIGVALSNTAASTGNYDVAINGGNGPDAVTFSIDTAGAAMTFNPANEIVIDGGPPVPFPGQANNTLSLHNPVANPAPIVTRNFGTIVAF
jgi:hypothetical protein